MKKWALGISILLAAGSLLGCGTQAAGNNESDTSANTQSIQETGVGVGAEITTLDTTQATDRNTFTVIEQIFEGLYRFNAEDELELALAAEPATISEDGLTYTFKLREDAEWSNGTPVTANDFVYAWGKMVNPASLSPNAYLFENIKNGAEVVKGEKELSEFGVTAVSDYELKVELEVPRPNFLSLLAIGWFFPQNEEFVELQGDNYGQDTDAIIYNGPFTLVDWKDGATSWAYEKNESYYEKDQVLLDRVNVAVVKEVSTGLNLYETGELDIVTLTGDYAKQFEDDENLIRKQELALQYLTYNASENNPLNNEHLRKAIALSIDRNELTESVLEDGSEPLGGLIPRKLLTNPETNEDFREDNGSFNDYDSEKAKVEWALVQEELGDRVEIELLTNDDATSKKVGTYIQSEVQEHLPGLTVTIRSVPSNVAKTERTSGNYDFSIAGWIAGDLDPTGFFVLLETDSPYNYGSYQNDEYQALIDESKTTYANDSTVRYANFLEAEKILMDTAAFQPLYQRTTNYLQRPTLQGLESHLLGSDFTFRNATIVE